MLAEVFLLARNCTQKIGVCVTAWVLPSFSRSYGNAFRKGKVPGVKVACDPARGGHDALGRVHRVLIPLVALQDHHGPVVLDLLRLDRVLYPCPVTKGPVSVRELPQTILSCRG